MTERISKKREPHPTLPGIKLRKPKPEKESGVLHAVIYWVRRMGGYALRVNSGGSMPVHHKYTSRKTGQTREYTTRIKLAPAGTPDDINCILGRFVAIETKRETEDALRKQKDVHEEIERAGGMVFIVDTSDEEAVKEVVAQVKARIEQDHWDWAMRHVNEILGSMSPDALRSALPAAEARFSILVEENLRSCRHSDGSGI